LVCTDLVISLKMRDAVPDYDRKVGLSQVNWSTFGVAVIRGEHACDAGCRHLTRDGSCHRTSGADAFANSADGMCAPPKFGWFDRALVRRKTDEVVNQVGRPACGPLPRKC
jgi:hypothetical protein